MLKKTPLLLVLFIVSLMLTSSAVARGNFEKQFVPTQSTANGVPYFQSVGHNINNLRLTLVNNGTFGTGFNEARPTDYFTGQALTSCEFPRNSRQSYLFAGAFWIGAIVGRDTLVSVAADGWSFVREFRPGEFPFDTVQKRSIAHPDDPGLYTDAISEEDYIMAYSDTSSYPVGGNDYFGRPHQPLNIKVQQRSFAWSYPYAEDFILFDFQIENVGFNELENVYMGIYVDGDVGNTSNTSGNAYVDDISGFLVTDSIYYPECECEFVETVFTAWLADNDGDPMGSSFGNTSIPGVTGTRILRTPSDELEVSFNWWVSDSPNRDFGPRERSEVGKWPEEFRDFRTGGLGTPEGDVNKYYIMRNQEFDYDQYLVGSIRSDDPLWLQPPQNLAAEWSKGMDTRYLLSFGPFNISPNEKLPITFAYIGGEDFHTNAENLDNLPDNPEAFVDNLDFSDFSENSNWSLKIYDNPGVDTDGDGYFGEYHYIDSIEDSTGKSTNGWIYTDSFPYRGDGVPDFKGASPPPAPTFWLTPSEKSIHVRFNGLASETTLDNFSQLVDFEGYRVYYAMLDNVEANYSMVTSYDVENFVTYYNFVNIDSNNSQWTVSEQPYTLIELMSRFPDDTTFTNPLDYDRISSFEYYDTLFYFTKQDYNASTNTRIRKIYPDEPYPSTLLPDSAQPSELTEDGYFKYFEYETEIYDANLLATVPYYVVVTAFDFGSPKSDLPALETSKVNGAQVVYALDQVQEEDELNVYVWPNPYRIDGGYQTNRFERPEGLTDNAADRMRALNFGNLPPKCTISIYTIDGDMVRTFEHDKDPSDPTSMFAEWDLITRNTQLIVSGLYYFVIETPNGKTQIGKFAIIM